MATILQISVSGLQAFQSKLATVSQNIANVNTEGYSRQTVDLTARPPEFVGFGYIGSGVKVAGITREYDAFINTQLISNTGLASQLNELYGLNSQLDNLVADPNAGLAPGLQNFFDAFQDVADDPSSLTARQVLLGQTDALINRFGNFQQRFDELAREANATIENSVIEVNSLAKDLAALNSQITAAFGNAANQPVNDLLDQRDLLVQKLAEHVSVSTVEQSDGALNVFIGSGQALVTGVVAQTLSTGVNEFDPTRKDIFVSNGNTTVNISQQLTGGRIGAATQFLDTSLEPARNAIGRIALVLASTVNAQNRLGMDLNGQLGGDFFSPLNTSTFGPVVTDSSRNSITGAGVVSAQITDAGSLTTSDYRLQYNGANQYTLTRLEDNTVFSIDASSGYPFTYNQDGVDFIIASAPGAGDSYLIRPTANGARGISAAISDPRSVAAAVPVRAENALSNTGTGQVGDTRISSATAYVADTYQVILADNAGAAAGGGVGVISEDGDNTVQYELRINGNLVYSQAEGAAPLADLNALAAQINGAVGTTGVRAYVNAAGTNLYLANEPPSATAITVTETLSTDAPADAADTVTGYFGSALTGVANTNTLTFSGAADSYIVLDSSSAAVADGAYTAGNTISFNGIQTSVSGTPNLGDVFTVSPNTSGVSDNRNVLLMAGLQNQLTLSGGTEDFNTAYTNLVAQIGTETRKVELTRDAQEVLLNQSVAAREAKSGVNLDEEAANMLQFQQAYQAVSQMIATADRMFQTIINVVSR